MLAQNNHAYTEVKMDFTTLEIGGIPILLLIPGLVEAAKHFGINGKRSTALALLLGFWLVGLAQAINLALVPEAALPWLSVVVVGIGGGLAVTGYYDLANRFIRPK
jgi:hypothetical protein